MFLMSYAFSTLKSVLFIYFGRTENLAEFLPDRSDNYTNFVSLLWSFGSECPIHGTQLAYIYSSLYLFRLSSFFYHCKQNYERTSTHLNFIKFALYEYSPFVLLKRPLSKHTYITPPAFVFIPRCIFLYFGKEALLQIIS